MTVRVNPWTDELVERVKVLWVNNSASEIVAILEGDGIYLTRNAVVGKLHRAGLTSEHKAELHPKPHNGHRRVNQRNHRGNGALVQKLRRPVQFSPRPFVCQEPPAEVVPLHVTLLELADNGCRWPYGEGSQITFCGCQKISDGPYCYSHDIISRPPQEQRKAWNRRAA